MIWLRHILCSFLIFCIWPCSANEITGRHGNPAWKTGQILVQPRVGVTATRLHEILARYNAYTSRKISGIDVHVVAVPAQAEKAVVQALENNPSISYAELDRRVELEEFIPDDPYFENAWHLQTLNMPNAWDVARGEGVVVAVLDTGVYAQHDDLSGRLVSGWNSANGGMDTKDINGHGTKVTGVIGAVTDNALGVASIAPGALIMPVRVTDISDGSAYTSAIASGLTWATDNGARVANISYAVTSFRTIQNAAQYMRNAGGVVVVAAGNTGTDTGYSDVAAIITVSATNSSDVKAGWSSYGNFIDVAAPGVGLWTTNRNNDYSTVSGTSFSSPATAATAALIMEANPNLSPGEVESILEDSAVDLGAAGWDPYYGHGRIDAAAAVLLARGGSTIDTDPPAVGITRPLNDATVTGMVPVDVSASDNIGVSRVELHVDGLLLATDDAEPYAFSWDSSGSIQGQQVVLTAYAYDIAGNSAEDTVTVWIADTIAPIVTAPPPVTTEATGELTSVKLGTSSAFDNVDGNVPVTANLTGPFSVGQHTVIWSATDSAGNTGTANQQVTVTDTTPPAISPPDNMVVTATGTLTSVNLGEAVAFDLVDGNVTATPTPLGPFPPGSNIVTWSATDAAGNTSTALQTVTVVDVEAPVITVPPDVTSEATGELTSVDLGVAQAVDNVDGAVAVSPSTNGPFPVGISEIIWSATDAAGNSATAKQRVTIIENVGVEEKHRAVLIRLPWLPLLLE